MAGVNQYEQDVEDLTNRPFAGVVARQLGRQDIGVKVATDQAQATSPDQAADIEAIAQHFRTAPSIVAGHFDAFKARYESERTAQQLRSAPATADWITKSPTHAALAKDDLGSLTTFESLLGTAKKAARAAGSGLASFAAGAYGAEQAAGERLGFPNFAKEAAGKAQAAQALSDRLMPTSDGLLEQGIYGGIASIGNMAPSIVLGILSGGASMLGTIGVTTGGQTYAQARQQGASPNKALLAGSIQGAVEVGTEFIPAHRLLGDLAAKSGVLKTLAHQLVPEIAGEEIATVLQDLNEWAFLPANKDRTFADYLAERPSAAAATAISTLVAVGATTAGAHATSHLVEKLGQTAAESKTIQRSPEKAEAFLAHATADTPVETSYAPVQAFTEYFQSKGINPAELAQQLTGKPEAYAQAVATGQDLAIPTSKLIVHPAFQEHNAFFASEIRLDPAQMNAREAADFEKQASEQAASPQAVEQPSVDPIRQNIVQQLQTAGVEESTAHSYATLYESAFSTLGERAGVDPVELFNRYGLKIERPELGSRVAPLEAGAAPTGSIASGNEASPSPAPEEVTLHQRPNFAAVEQYAKLQAKQPEGVRRIVQSMAEDARDLFGSEHAAERFLGDALSDGVPVDPNSREGLFLNRFGFKLGEHRSFNQGERGKITFGNERKFTIDLLQGADLSTVIHESAHFFLEVMRDLAPNSPQIQADLDTIRSAFGEDNTDQHEGFASGFEKYLLEGKAPTAELRSSFARFRAWLLGVYRSLSGLNVSINDDVRAVFDRLLASDAAIAQAQAEGHIAPLFTDAASAGMTEADFAKYQGLVEDASEKARTDLQQQVMAEWTREQQAWWKAEKKAIREQVTAEFTAKPEYQARKAIREDLKGVDLETVAELYGFSSADELSQALKDTPPMPRAIAAETNRRMTAKYGDLLIDGRLADKATEAVNNYGRQRVIEAELKALNKGLSAGVIPPADVVKRIAEQTIARTKVRELRPGLHLVAAERASRKAFELKDTDRVAAMQAKRQELLSHALYREATRVKDLIESRVAWVKAHDTEAARMRTGKAGEAYLDQWDGFLDRYEFKRVTQKVLDRRANLSDFIAQQEAQGLPVDLPAVVLNDARKVNYQQLTVEDFQGVTDGMKSLLHLAHLKGRLLTAVANRDFVEAVTTIDASIREKNPAKKLPLEFLPKDLKARKVADWFASHTKIATFARALDGYVDGGPVWDYIIRPINEAATREAAMNTEATTALHALMTDAYTGREIGKLHDKLYIPAIDDSLSKEARLAVALNWGNEGNRQRIRDGRHWTDQQVAAILNTLDARDARFVQGVWDFIDTYWSAIEAKQKRVTGIGPEKVEASPFKLNTRDAGPVEMKGGYYPLAYDGRLSARAGSFIEGNDATLQKQAAYVKATTRRGHTEARASHVSEPVRLELSVLYGHVEQVIHDLSHHEMLIDVGRVLGDKRIQSAIYDTHGDLVYQQFKGALKDIAYGVRPAADSIEKSLNFIRHGTTVAGLAWNLWTAVQQPLGVVDGMQRVGPSWVLKGLTRMVRDAASLENTAAFITAKSEMMKLRGGTYQREVAELRNAVSVSGGWFDNLLRTVTLDHIERQDVEDSYFFFIEQAQRLADMPTWLGQYEKSLAAGEVESRAIALADQAVLDAQGGGQIKDLAQVQRGSPAVKLFTNFYSYGNLKYNQTAAAYGQTNFRKVGSVGQFGVNLLLLYAFPAAATVLLAKAFGRGDDDDSFIAAMGKELLGAALNTMVLVREFGGLLHASNRGYEGPAGVRAITAGYNFLTQAKQGELDRAAVRATEDAAGIVFRLPLPSVQRSVDGFVALQDGKTKNPLALVSGAPRDAR